MSFTYQLRCYGPRRDVIHKTHPKLVSFFTLQVNSEEKTHVSEIIGKTSFLAVQTATHRNKMKLSALSQVWANLNAAVTIRNSRFQGGVFNK